MIPDDAFWAAIGLPKPNGLSVIAENVRRRDEFARAALTGLCSKDHDWDRLPDDCFDIADAMMAESDRRTLRDIAALKEKPQ